jgi:hypothetical protein
MGSFEPSCGPHIDYNNEDSGACFVLTPLSDTLTNDHDPIPFCLHTHFREFVSHLSNGFFDRGPNPEPKSAAQERARPIHGAAAGFPG